MPKRICPLCGGNNTSRILWGMPVWTPELEADLNSKKIVLGGCCITDKAPAFHCNDCDKDIIYPTEQEELQTVYFDFEIGGFFNGYRRIEVEKLSEKITAKYYPPAFARNEEAICITITDDEFMTFIHKVYRSSLLEWKEEYDNPDIMDGTQWAITVRYENGEKRKWFGSNDYPPLWKKFLKAVNILDIPDIR